MRIRISNQGEPSRIESFEQKSEIRIGRVPTNDLVLAERGISSNHARLVFDHNGQLYVEDLGSTNGTFVNGSQVDGLSPVAFGDEIQIGQVRLRLERARK
jgi:pSer/pThr/pTyr-binding forkhead associated (FHA) protein